MTGEYPEADAAYGELVDGVHKVAQISAEPIELPYQEGVAAPESLQAGRKAGPVVTLTRSPVLVDAH